MDKLFCKFSRVKNPFLEDYGDKKQQLVSGRAALSRMEGEFTRLSQIYGNHLIFIGTDGDPEWKNRSTRFLKPLYTDEVLKIQYTISGKEDIDEDYGKITVDFEAVVLSMLKFQGKTALITGSGTGIGQAIAKKFVENGASVIILGRRREPLDETSKMLEGVISEKNSGANVKIFSGVDVADEPAMTGMFDAIKNENITVDYVINNAGVSGPVTCFANAPLDDFKSTVGIHLTGAFWGSVQALKVMKEGGKIITISTFFTEERPLEQRPYRFRSPYTASQGAKNRLAEAMSWELVERGIISIATNPGPVHSDRMNRYWNWPGNSQKVCRKWRKRDNSGPKT